MEGRIQDLLYIADENVKWYSYCEYILKVLYIYIYMAVIEWGEAIYVHIYIHICI